MVKVDEQLKDAEVVLVINDDETMTIVVDLVNTDQEFSGSIKLNKKAFDETTKKRIEDQETFNNALDTMHNQFGVSEENSIDLKDQGLVDLEGAREEIEAMDTIPVYFNGEDYLSPYPIRSFPKFDNSMITSKIAKKLEGAYKSDKELKGLPVSDHELKHQFLIPFKVFIEGEEKHFYISQLQDDLGDNVVRTKYQNKQIGTIEDTIQKMEAQLDDVTGDRAEKLQNKIDKSKRSLEQIIDRARASKIEEFKEVFDLDLEEMIEEEEVIDLRLTEVNKTSLPNQRLKGENYYFVVATPTSEPHEEEDLDETEDEL